jgi:outer membrane cobalamin receptor
MKALPVSLLVATLGCGHAAKQPSAFHPAPGTFLITAEQIEKSGAQNAWPVLQQSAPMLQAQNDKDGRPARLTRRGRSSFLLDDAPAVLVDGVRMPDFRNLDALAAQSIREIAILNGVEATLTTERTPGVA